MSITYAECVSVASFSQHEKCMSHYILSSVACLALTYFSTLSQREKFLGKKFIELKMCVLIFPATFV
jgi:hypothetical protein